MKRKNKQTERKILTVIWIITAVTALVVTIVYFGRLQEMYAALEAIEAQTKDNGTKDLQAGDNSADITQTADAAESNSGNRNEDNNPSSDSNSTEYDYGTSAGKSDVTDNLPDGVSNDEDSAENRGENATEAEEKPEGDSAADNVDQTEAVDSDSSGTSSEGSNATEQGEEVPYYYDSTLDPSKPIIALSFDDGPSIYTERILAALAKYNVKATFFMVGYNVKNYPDRVRMVYEAGCEIGNHTTDHSRLIKSTEAEIKAAVFDNEDWINAIVPVGQIVVRPPYGDVNATVKEIVQRPMFNWSVDSLDWKSKNADSIVAEIKANAKDGYIVLMHDLYESTADATERIIPWLLEQGYQITCISNMYAARGEETLPGHLYRYTNPAPKAENEAEN